MSTSQDLTPATFKKLLERLVKTPEFFTPDDLKSALAHIFTPDLIPPAQVGAFLAALHIHRVERRPESLAAAAEVLRGRARKAAIEGSEEDFIVDIVGTGGDGYDTFNVSTTASVVAAGAGARVVKHGSRASTSASGSADLLERLGCLYPAPPKAGTALPISRVPFAFILAPHYHPSLALLAPIRKQLPFRTLFNVLGPLINPACPRGMVLGVADKELGHTFAQSLSAGGVKRALVVSGTEGLDEISCAGTSWVWELREDGTIHPGTVHPSQFGLPAHPLSAVKGAGPEENAETFRRLLTSGKEIPVELMPVLDFVLMNASALLVVAGIANDYKDGVEKARESITSGKAWEALMIFKKEIEGALSKGHI